MPPSELNALRLLAWWDRHRATFLGFGTLLMIVLGSGWLTYELWRAVAGYAPAWPGSPEGAVDLLLRRAELDRWFGATPFRWSDEHFRPHAGYYPPASYLMLWPFLGWLPTPVLRVVWAGINLACLAWLGTLTRRHAAGPASTPLEKRFLLWVPLSMYAAGATIGNGQHTLHVLVTTMAAVLLLIECRPSVRRDYLAGLLFVAAMVKPTLAAPFFWMLLFRADSVRPAAVAVAGYLALSGVALSFRPIDVRGYVGSFEMSATIAAEVRYSDLSALMGRLSLGQWTAPATLCSLGLFGAWVAWQRRADPWLLLGVTAIVARMLTYHRWYDDLLLLVPLITLFRVARLSQAPQIKVAAGILFAALWLSLLAPGGLYLLPSPLDVASAMAQTGLWTFTLIFLLRLVHARPRAF